MNKLPSAMRFKYEEFMNEGSLIVMDGNILDMMQVFDDLDEHILSIGYSVGSSIKCRMLEMPFLKVQWEKVYLVLQTKSILLSNRFRKPHQLLQKL